MNWYLFSGYAVFWILIFIYIVYLHRKQRQQTDELRSLVESLEE